MVTHKQLGRRLAVSQRMPAKAQGSALEILLTALQQVLDLFSQLVTVFFGTFTSLGDVVLVGEQVFLGLQQSFQAILQNLELMQRFFNWIN